MRDYSHFNAQKFKSQLAQLDWSFIKSQNNIDKVFSKFYNKINTLVNKYAPYKDISKRRKKQLLKPWITQGTRTSIRIKNLLYKNGNQELYKTY